MLAAALAAFVATYAFIPWLIRSLRGTTAVGKDLNKAGRPLVPEMGGLGVMLGFYLGVSLLMVLAASVPAPFFYASLAASLGAGFVGLVDDMFGLRKRAKALLPFLLAIPLGVVSYSTGDVYLLGINLGLMTVLVVPLGITSAANATNMLEGLNGLGAGMGILMTVTLVAVAYLQGTYSGLYIAFPLLGSLGAFLVFNKYPARVFPGDSMTLFMGAAIASIAIVAHQKTLGAVLFAPMILEFGLKLRSHFQAENYGAPDQSGRLHYSGPIGSLTHVIMRKRPMKEWQIVASVWGIEALVSSIVLLTVVLRW